MTDNPHPLYRQKACKWCAKGWRLSTDGEHISGRAPARYRPCTAPTEAGYIAQLKARIAELEKDKARLAMRIKELEMVIRDVPRAEIDASMSRVEA